MRPHFQAWSICRESSRKITFFLQHYWKSNCRHEVIFEENFNGVVKYGHEILSVSHPWVVVTLVDPDFMIPPTTCGGPRLIQMNGAVKIESLKVFFLFDRSASSQKLWDHLPYGPELSTPPILCPRLTIDWSSKNHCFIRASPYYQRSSRILD